MFIHENISTFLRLPPQYKLLSDFEDESIKFFNLITGSDECIPSHDVVISCFQDITKLLSDVRLRLDGYRKRIKEGERFLISERDTFIEGRDMALSLVNAASQTYNNKRRNVARRKPKEVPKEDINSSKVKPEEPLPDVKDEIKQAACQSLEIKREIVLGTTSSNLVDSKETQQQTEVDKINSSTAISEYDITVEDTSNQTSSEAFESPCDSIVCTETTTATTEDFAVSEATICPKIGNSARDTTNRPTRRMKKIVKKSQHHCRTKFISHEIYDDFQAIRNANRKLQHSLSNNHAVHQDLQWTVFDRGLFSGQPPGQQAYECDHVLLNFNQTVSRKAYPLTNASSRFLGRGIMPRLAQQNIALPVTCMISVIWNSSVAYGTLG